MGGRHVISAETDMGGRGPKNSIASVATYLRCGRRSVGFALAHLLLGLLEVCDVLLVLLLSDFDERFATSFVQLAPDLPQSDFHFFLVVLEVSRCFGI